MEGSFCTSIHCMDGRIQIPIIQHLTTVHPFDYVDTITRPGPCGVICSIEAELKSVFDAIRISISAHGSTLISIAGHHDCAADPLPEDAHVAKIRKSVDILKKHFPRQTIIGLYVDENGECTEIS